MSIFAIDTNEKLCTADASKNILQVTITACDGECTVGMNKYKLICLCTYTYVTYARCTVWPQNRIKGQHYWPLWIKSTGHQCTPDKELIMNNACYHYCDCIDICIINVYCHHYEFHSVYRQSKNAVQTSINVTMVWTMSKTTTPQICKSFLSMLCLLTAEHMMISSNGNIISVTGPVDSPHEGQWHEALIFWLICAWTDGWAYNGDAGGLRCHRAH